MTTRSRAQTATPRKDEATGTWWFVVDVGRGPDGKRRQARRRGFPTKRAAQEALDKLRVNVAEQTFVPPATITLGEYLEQWLAGLPASGIRPSTHASYSEYVRNHVIPRLGGRRLQQLAPGELDQLYSTLLAEGRRDGTGGLSPRSVRYVHTILRKALADAHRKGVVVRNVADAATPPSAKSTRAPEMTTWSPDELHTFLEHTADHEWFALFRLAGMTGMRRGELCGLRWADVDFDAGRLAVRQQIINVKGAIQVGEVKTDASRRVVDLGAKTVQVLRVHRRRQLEARMALGDGYYDANLVFPRPDGRPLDPDRVSKVFNRLVAASGLPRIRFHDLRHSHATHLIAAGHHPKVISDRLGHGSVVFTLDRYGHVLPNLQSEAAEAVERLVDEG